MLTATSPDAWQSHCCLETINGLLQVALFLEYPCFDQHVQWMLSNLACSSTQLHCNSVPEQHEMTGLACYETTRRDHDNDDDDDIQNKNRKQVTQLAVTG